MRIDGAIEAFSTSAHSMGAGAARAIDRRVRLPRRCVRFRSNGTYLLTEALPSPAPPDLPLCTAAARLLRMSRWRRKTLYLRGPDGVLIKGKRVHWWSFVLRYPDSRVVRFLRVLPTVRISLGPSDDAPVAERRLRQDKFIVAWDGAAFPVWSISGSNRERLLGLDPELRHDLQDWSDRVTRTFEGERVPTGDEIVRLNAEGSALTVRVRKTVGRSASVKFSPIAPTP
jgi:hypothetical protein